MIDADNDGFADYGFAVGTSGLALEYRDHSWHRLAPTGLANPTSVVALGASDMYVADQSGKIMHFDGGSFSQVLNSNRAIMGLARVAHRAKHFALHDVIKQ